MTLEEIKDYLRRTVEETQDGAELLTEDCQIILDALGAKSQEMKKEEAEKLVLELVLAQHSYDVVQLGTQLAKNAMDRRDAAREALVSALCAAPAPSMSLTEFCAEAADAALAHDDDRMVRLYGRMNHPADASEMVELRPMGEAPIDGTWILVWMKERQVNAPVVIAYRGALWRDEDFKYETENMDGWLPLPKVEVKP